jgi:hypothetical protein
MSMLTDASTPRRNPILELFVFFALAAVALGGIVLVAYYLLAMLRVG